MIVFAYVVMIAIAIDCVTDNYLLTNLIKL